MDVRYHLSRARGEGRQADIDMIRSMMKRFAMLAACIALTASAAASTGERHLIRIMPETAIPLSSGRSIRFDVLTGFRFQGRLVPAGSHVLARSVVVDAHLMHICAMAFTSADGHILSTSRRARCLGTIVADRGTRVAHGGRKGSRIERGSTMTLLLER